MVARMTLRALVLALTLSGSLFAQVEVGSGFQPSCWAVVNARIVVSPEVEIETGTLVIRNGLIVAVGKDVTAPPDADVIDAKGLTVYAGFIDAATTSFLGPDPAISVGRNIDFSKQALASTPEDARKGLTPEHEAVSNLKIENGPLENRRKAGFTSLHVLPMGRIASGQGVHFTTSGAPSRETTLRSATFAEFELLAPGQQGGYPATLMGTMAHLRQAILDARRNSLHHQLYEKQAANVVRPPEDPVLEALAEVTEKQLPPVFAANSRDAIHRTLDFCEEQQLPMPYLLGGREAWECLDRLAGNCPGVFVMADWGDEPKVEPVPKDFQAKVPDPTRVQEDRRRKWRENIAGLKALAEKSLKFALVSGNAQNVDLLKAARQATAQGVPRQVVLAALTRDAAVLLGQEKRLGVLEAGRLAHVVVLNGPFDDERSRVRYVFVDGLKYEYNREVQPVTGPEPAPLALGGTWNVEIDGADGKTQATVVLAQSGKTFSGTFESSQGEGQIRNGKTTDKVVEFTASIGAGAQAFELKFSGSPVEGKPDQLTGTLKTAFGASKWTATKKPEPQVAANPVTIGVEPDGTATASKSDELPTELESDRLLRKIQTGGNVLIRGATVLTGKEELPETSVLIKAGKITAIGKDLQPEEGMAVIEAAGRFVMPGIIDTHSHIMFSQGMGGVNESTRSIVPEVRVRDVVSSNDPGMYRALAGGVTTIRLLHGSANVVGGQDAVVKLKVGKPSKELVLWDAPQGVKFALGENVKFQQNRFPNTRLGVEATLNRAFLEAIEYRKKWRDHDKATADAAQAANLLPPRRDLRLEALADIVDHQKFIHSHCYRADEILMLLRVTSGLGVKIWSLQHVLEGYKVAPEILAHGASCSTFSDWWAYKMEAYDAIPWNTALLHDAGVNVCLKSDDAELMRHMYAEAAKLMRYGNLPADVALRTITLNPARELHLDDRIGSIEIGKDGDVGLFNAHPLSAFARCEMTLIEGEVYFQREAVPTAMSATGQSTSAAPGPLVLAPQEIRTKEIEIAPSPSKQYALVGAVLHPVESADVAEGTLLIADGKIAALGTGLTIPSDVPTIDLKGLHIYPGLVDAGSTLGLTEVGKVNETQDYSEAGLFHPDLRAAVAVNPDSELIPVARAGGITTTYIRPQGGVISGQGSIIRLAGWTAPDMAINVEAALQVQWRDNQVDALREFLQTGRLYHRIKQAAAEGKAAAPTSDPRYEALGPYLKGERPIFVEANSRKAIVEAVQFAEKEKLKIVLTGGSDAWKVADELKKRDIAVILGPVMSRPEAGWDPYDAQYAAAGRLHEAGVRFCIRSNSASNSRNVPFEAAMAVAYGLPQDAALKAVTLSAAQVLGIDAQVGSLAVGKVADLIITDGSPLQPSTQIKSVFVAGKPLAPESKQTRLYEKYRQRLEEVSKPAAATATGP